MSARTATCSCGALKVEARTEPRNVAVCHCMACQRRTGSTFGVSAFFNTGDVTTSGTSATFVHAGGSGQALTRHFCPACGSTVFWFAAKFPGLIGVAVGAFADPSFPAPSASVWERSRHAWVGVEGEVAHFPEGPSRA